jgi:hypothetical protein
VAARLLEGLKMVWLAQVKEMVPKQAEKRRVVQLAQKQWQAMAMLKELVRLVEVGLDWLAHR